MRDDRDHLLPDHIEVATARATAGAVSIWVMWQWASIEGECISHPHESNANLGPHAREAQRESGRGLRAFLGIAMVSSKLAMLKER